MIIDGRKISEEVLDGLAEEIRSKKLKLRMAAVLVGDDPEFKKFVELKGKAAERAGISFTMHQFPADIATEELQKEIDGISQSSNGVLIELPLPEHIDSGDVLNKIPVEKDVDVLSGKAEELFYSNQSKVLPPAVEATRIVLEKLDIDPKNKKVAIFGQGQLIGKPVSHWLQEQGAEVYKIRSTTENPQQYSKKADIVISGVGKPNLIKGDMIKEGAVVIDFGYGKNSDGKMVGDVDFESASKKSSFITPVPGGMGPILIVAVLKNLVILNEKH